MSSKEISGRYLVDIAKKNVAWSVLLHYGEDKHENIYKYRYEHVFKSMYVYHIYPTPPLGQDMTQGQSF